MMLTRDFKETVQARAQIDTAFRDGLLDEGVKCLLAGDVDTGKIILRDYIDATMGFELFSRLTGKPLKSLEHMFEPDSNPEARHIIEIISRVRQHGNPQIKVNAV